ncbi:Salicylate hydroxylase [compost metagenome]
MLDAYDAVRRPRACRVQRTSFEAGELYEFRDPAVLADEERLGKVLAERFDWLWNHDMQEDLLQARELLGLRAQAA